MEGDLAFWCGRNPEASPGIPAKNRGLQDFRWVRNWGSAPDPGIC
jgi:hypothetical protein